MAKTFTAEIACAFAEEMAWHKRGKSDKRTLVNKKFTNKFKKTIDKSSDKW